MTEIPYSELRNGKGRNGDGLFFQGAQFESKLIRWWTNDCPDMFWRWFSLGPFSHAELLVWDAAVEYPPDAFGLYKKYPNLSNVRLCSWGSVSGGPRKTPLYRLVRSYNQAGGKVFWAPLGENKIEDCGYPYRSQIIERANAVWGSRYPSTRQWIRTALRNWFKEPDSDPEGFTCWEFVAHCLGLEKPASWYGFELANCGLFGEAKEIVLDGGKE